MDTLVIYLYYALGFMISLIPMFDQNMPYEKKCREHRTFLSLVYGSLDV